MRKEQARQAAGQGCSHALNIQCWVGPEPRGRLRRALASSPGCDARCALLRAREPIFSETHTNEFCGIGKSTPEPAGPCDPLRPGRWVYEKKRSPASVGGLSGPYSAPLHGSLRRPLSVSFHTSPLSRGALRSAGVPTIAASTTPAPLLPEHLSQGPARHLGRLRSGAREYPMCAEGWAMWVLGGSPDLFKATGGTCRLGTPQG